MDDGARDPGRLPFADRTQAGRVLAQAVLDSGEVAAPAVVLGLPRGGVPVAAEVASALGAPLDVLVVRKLGAPGQPELAVGAVGGGGVRVLNDDLLRGLRVPERVLDQVTDDERAEVVRRERAYRGGAPPVALAGRTAVLVDDGLATGATVRAALAVARAAGASRVVVAAPVGSRPACAAVAAEADALVCPHRPEGFRAVGAYYADFDQTDDEEVRRLLAHRRA